MILEGFEVLKNACKMGTHIGSFREYLIVNTDQDEDFQVCVISTFVTKVTSLANEDKKKHCLPSSARIKQIQVGWKGRIDITKYLKEKCTFLEDKKSATFFKIYDVVSEQDVHHQYEISH